MRKHDSYGIYVVWKHEKATFMIHEKFQKVPDMQDKPAGIFISEINMSEAFLVCKLSRLTIQERRMSKLNK